MKRSDRFIRKMTAQSCLTLCNPVRCSPPGSSVHGDSPGENPGAACHFLPQAIFPTRASKPRFLRWQGDSRPLSPPVLIKRTRIKQLQLQYSARPSPATDANSTVKRVEAKFKFRFSARPPPSERCQPAAAVRRVRLQQTELPRHPRRWRCW